MSCIMRLMERTLDRENENQTLGEVAQFTFTLLGSYWVNSGFDAASQKSYTDESAETEYSKYSLTDGKSELSRRYIKFFNNIKEKYHAMSEISFYMRLFPVFLLDGITRFDPMFSCDKKHRLLNALMCYIAWAFYDAERKQGKPQESGNRRAVIQCLATERYSGIVSHAVP